MPRTRFPVKLNGRYLSFKESREFEKLYPPPPLLTPAQLEEKRSREYNVPDTSHVKSRAEFGH